MRWTPSQIEPFGLIPYAVYGGYVVSFRVPQDERIYDAALLDDIMFRAHDRANSIVSYRNKDQS